MQLGVKPLLGPWMPIRLQRWGLKALAAVAAPCARVGIAPCRLDGVPAERLMPEHPKPAPVLLYFHGGGYCIGAPVTHRPLCAELAWRGRHTVYSVDYRLAPEHPFPAALDDAEAAFRGLIRLGHSAEDIVLVGDSAGGGLALALATALQERGEALPAALVLLSPWLDLSCSGDSQRERADRDPILSPATLRRWARRYLGRHAADHPACSPLFAALEGLPPVLIHVGADEILLDDSRRLHARLIDAHVKSELCEFEGLWHDFHLQVGMAGADEAIDEILEFLTHRECVASAAARCTPFAPAG